QRNIPPPGVLARKRALFPGHRIGDGRIPEVKTDNENPACHAGTIEFECSVQMQRIPRRSSEIAGDLQEPLRFGGGRRNDQNGASEEIRDLRMNIPGDERVLTAELALIARVGHPELLGFNVRIADAEDVVVERGAGSESAKAELVDNALDLKAQLMTVRRRPGNVHARLEIFKRLL